MEAELRQHEERLQEKTDEVEAWEGELQALAARGKSSGLLGRQGKGLHEMRIPSQAGAVPADQKEQCAVSAMWAKHWQLTNQTTHTSCLLVIPS